MKLEFPKIVHEVALSEFTPELTQTIFVWVNPPSKMLKDLDVALSDYIKSKGVEEDALLASLSELLSQSIPATHWSVDELKEMIVETTDANPQFWGWFNNRIYREIADYRTSIKKN
jgi:hypothetical protein